MWCATVSAVPASASLYCSVCTTAWDTQKPSSFPWWQVEWQNTWGRTQWKIASLLQSPSEGCISSTFWCHDSACAPFVIDLQNIFTMAAVLGVCVLVFCHSRLVTCMSAAGWKVLMLCAGKSSGCMQGMLGWCVERQDSRFSSKPHILTQPICFSYCPEAGDSGVKFQSLLFLSLWCSQTLITQTHILHTHAQPHIHSWFKASCWTYIVLAYISHQVLILIHSSD